MIIQNSREYISVRGHAMVQNGQIAIERRCGDNTQRMLKLMGCRCNLLFKEAKSSILDTKIPKTEKTWDRKQSQIFIERKGVGGFGHVVRMSEGRKPKQILEGKGGRPMREWKIIWNKSWKGKGKVCKK